MERSRLVGVTGPGGPGSGYAVGGRLVLTSAHVVAGGHERAAVAVGRRVEVFHPGADRALGAVVVWCGTAGGRDDAALVLADEGPGWNAPVAPVRWGRMVTDRPGAECQTWGLPDLAQHRGRAVEALQVRGVLDPGSGFVGNQYVLDLVGQPPQWSAPGTSPWGGLSGAAVFCDRLLVGVVSADRAHFGHARLNAVPAYVLRHDPAFRAALADHGSGPAVLEPVELQHLADPAAAPVGRDGAVRSPAALLHAARQTVPFQGREQLLDELTRWCARAGFGAWLLHGPGGQGKTRLAHQLASVLAGEQWAVLWPRPDAAADQLRQLRDVSKPLLVVLDYAETRTGQLAALVEAAAEHPGTTPFKLLLLARTDGDWWRRATTASSLAEDYLDDAPARPLAPLEDDPDSRPAAYRAATQALAAALAHVQGLPDRLPDHDWPGAANRLPVPARLGQDAYGNALTLHMTALADLLDTAAPGPARSGSGATPGGAAEGVEDRLLGHERRYWHHSAAARGLSPGLAVSALETALAAAQLVGATDREHADAVWLRLPLLADQPRDRRDAVTAWISALYPAAPYPAALYPAALYPAAAPLPWGALQPDRLAERHIGRVLDADPALADHLLDGADDAQAGQLLTGYSRAAAHPVFQNRLDTQLTALCVRHHQRLAAQIITTATRTDHPAPLTAALGAVSTDPATDLDDLTSLSNGVPLSSRSLADTALQLAQALADRHRALARTDPDAHLPSLATSLNNVSVRLGGLGRWEEGLAAAREAVGHYRVLAEASPDLHLSDLAASLNNLSIRLGELGRREEALAAVREAAVHYRVLAEARPDVHLPILATCLNNLSARLGALDRREEALAAIHKAVEIRRLLVDACPDAYLPDLATSLNNLFAGLGALGRWEEGVPAIREAVDIRRALADAGPDAHLPDLAGSLQNLSAGLGELGRREEGLVAGREAVEIRRALVEADPDVHLSDLAGALNNLSVELGAAGQWEEGLVAGREAVEIRRALVEADPDVHLSDLATSLNNLSLRLGELGLQAEGLAVVREAVGLYRTLVDADPDAHLSDLAGALNNLSADLCAVGLTAESLAAAREAVGSYRTLVEARPGVLLPELAGCLHNLSVVLGAVGLAAEGLAAGREAVDIRRVLANARPDAYLSDLAMSLYNLSIDLGAVGRRGEGLVAIREAVGYYRTLAEANPVRFGSALKHSRDAVAWLEALPE